MGDVVNLNRFRKLRDRAQREKEAEENRIRFGRTKAEKNRDHRIQERDALDLDGKKLDDPA